MTCFTSVCREYVAEAKIVCIENDEAESQQMIQAMANRIEQEALDEPFSLQ